MNLVTQHFSHPNSELYVATDPVITDMHGISHWCYSGEQARIHAVAAAILMDVKQYCTAVPPGLLVMNVSSDAFCEFIMDYKFRQNQPFVKGHWCSYVDFRGIQEALLAVIEVMLFHAPTPIFGSFADSQVAPGGG
ncbi:hypothetical protein H4R20_002360 [Coemansia guatemalensis]|uniref:Uncharacterized protein n=1 Tax=Coemansia guatemalensis TaxID=2761395 RepID=A0A9W8LSD2_9FUNG|nr:hypothetical protein H4R20_002360 [Coemansia guatemalensis]